MLAKLTLQCIFNHTNMTSADLEVVNVLVFQQFLESVENEKWEEAVMALYKLYDIEDGQAFTDLNELSVQVEAA